jgi:hypothetical protein
MLKFLRKRKAQSTMEYAVLIIIVIGALLSIQQYLKRGLQGRMRQAADDIGDQYSVGNMNMTRVTRFKGRTNETYRKGAQNTILIGNETTNVTYNIQIINMEQEYWG